MRALAIPPGKSRTVFFCVLGTRRDDIPVHAHVAIVAFDHDAGAVAVHRPDPSLQTAFPLSDAAKIRPYSAA